jgi:hypothetical protein
MFLVRLVSSTKLDYDPILMDQYPLELFSFSEEFYVFHFGDVP